MLRRQVSIFLFLLLITATVTAQDVAQDRRARILDDTTNLTYGPNSTLYTTEWDLRFNKPSYRVIDTTLYTSYRQSHVEQKNYYYQNLGLDGTTLRPIFYELPKNIGVSPGQEGSAPFYRGPEDIRYFNTRSPYSRLSLFLGGGNRSITDVQFSRNDSVTLNMGFDFKTFQIDKQIARQGRGDRRVEATQYDVYAHLRSKNLKYQMMANFTRSRHIQNESGGIDTTEIGDFFDEDVVVFLNGPINDELRQGLHMYHQYSFKDFLEVYGSIGSYRQRNQFIDNSADQNAEYYGQFLINASSTFDSTDYKHTQLEAGIKGNVGKIYYNAFWKRRKYDFINIWADSVSLPIPLERGGSLLDRSGTEYYAGFHTGYRFSRNTDLYAGFQYLAGGFFEGYANFRGRNYDLSYRRGKYKPTFLHQAYFGNHRLWVNNFRPVFADSFDGEYLFDLNRLVVGPSFGFDLITDYIYFDKDTLPAQNSGNVVLMSPGLKFSINFLRRFNFDANVIYTMMGQQADSVIAIPEIFAYARLYYKNFFFGGNLEALMGVDVNYKSAYYGNAYDPVTQQFYLQDHTLVEGVPIANLFLNFKVKRANLFAKMNNLTQMITGEGYLVAPLYRGLPPTFDFGFTIWFFD